MSDEFVAWGKLQRDGERIRTHLLVDHMHDVARLAVYVFLHDIGTANAIRVNIGAGMNCALSFKFL